MQISNIKNQNDKLKFKDKRVGMLGLGEENVALVKFLCAQDIEVVVCDEKGKEGLGEYYEQIKDLPVEFRLGADYLDNLQDFKTIFRTPGLPYLNEKIQEAKNAGVEISSQIKLFFGLCPSPIVGVTGTKGKGTTATLISEILMSENRKKKIENKNVYLAGNIGTPPISFLEKLTANDIVVLELSSFQLQDLEKSPHIAVVLDIKEDHLNYHANREEYVKAKENIVAHQIDIDFAVINADYASSADFRNLTKAKIYWFSRKQEIEQGAYVKNNEFILKIDDEENPICKTSEVILKGEHNFENICAAITAAYLAGADLESIEKAVKNFKGLEHRLEFVKDVNGVKYYNDSFSTTPDTTIAAIKSFPENPIILLVGGSEKNANFSELAKEIRENSVKTVISIGSTAERIIKEIGESPIEIISEIKSMEEAVKLANEKSKKNDVVILSPASASFDHYKNYKERGEIFKKLVLELY